MAMFLGAPLMIQRKFLRNFVDVCSRIALCCAILAGQAVAYGQVVPDRSTLDRSTSDRIKPVQAAVNDASLTQEYPRANAVATLQRLAGNLEAVYVRFAPGLNQILPPRARLALESNLAFLNTALSAYALADVHGERAQRIALVLRDYDAAGAQMVARAENALTVGDYARCEQLAQALAQLALDSRSDRLRMRAEVYLGILERRRGNLDGATAHQQTALELARKLGDETARARALAHLGTINRDRGDFAQALDLQLQALAIGEKIDDRTELIYRNLALLYRELGDEATSKKYFDKAITAAERNGNASYYATVYGSYSSSLNDTHDYVTALAAASETLALDQVLNDRPAMAFEQLESGRALLGLNRLGEADTNLKAALAAGRAMGQHEIVSKSLVALAEAALNRGDRQLARQLLDETFASPKASQSKPLLAQAYALHEQLAIAEGNPTLALKYAHEQAALREEIMGLRANRRLSALETQNARAASEQQLALLTEDNQLQTARLEQQRLQRNFGIAALVGLAILLGLYVWRFLGVRRLNRALALRNEEVEAKRAALSVANERLERQTHELYQAAITDPMTGVFNRGHLLRQLDARIMDCERNGRELAALLIDFDHFKQINDARGHLFGDRVLVAGVQTIRQWLDPSDLLGRYGGEEFIAVVTDRDLASVRVLAERLRLRVAETLATSAPELQAIATISIGVAMLSQLPQPVRLEDLIEAADRAVYTAKASGRNKVMNYVA
jgi:diguanylate cyclase (GGDEF)-like protein